MQTENKQKSTSKKLTCEICNKKYSNKNNLQTHINTIHKRNLPYKCPYETCNKSYLTKNRLKVHMRTHTGEKPYTCTICNKTFNEKGNLSVHLIRHSPNPQFECPKCLKKYTSKGHLKEHINIAHNNIKKYICNYCKKKFGKKSILDEHIRTHTKEKPFKCLFEGCTRCFSEKGNMKSHYKTHFKKDKNKNVNDKNNICCEIINQDNVDNKENELFFSDKEKEGIKKYYSESNFFDIDNDFEGFSFDIYSNYFDID